MSKDQRPKFQNGSKAALFLELVLCPPKYCPSDRAERNPLSVSI